MNWKYFEFICMIKSNKDKTYICIENILVLDKINSIYIFINSFIYFDNWFVY